MVSEARADGFGDVGRRRNRGGARAGSDARALASARGSRSGGNSARLSAPDDTQPRAESPAPSTGAAAHGGSRRFGRSTGTQCARAARRGGDTGRDSRDAGVAAAALSRGVRTEPRKGAEVRGD